MYSQCCEQPPTAAGRARPGGTYLHDEGTSIIHSTFCSGHGPLHAPWLRIAGQVSVNKIQEIRAYPHWRKSLFFSQVYSLQTCKKQRDWLALTFLSSQTVSLLKAPFVTHPNNRQNIFRTSHSRFITTLTAGYAFLLAKRRLCIIITEQKPDDLKSASFLSLKISAAVRAQNWS